MKKFEYKYLESRIGMFYDLDDIFSGDEFNKLGQEGWELVTAFSIDRNSKGGTNKIVSIFKREIENF